MLAGCLGFAEVKVHENHSIIFFRETTSLIEHEASVGVTTTRGVGAAVGCMGTFVAGIMNMVCNRFNIVVNIRVEVLAALALITRALDHVK